MFNGFQKMIKLMFKKVFVGHIHQGKSDTLYLFCCFNEEYVS